MQFETKHKEQFTAAMKATLEGLFEQKKQGIDDPQKRKAMEVLAMTDAAKSYAFTQIYAVSEKHCDTSVGQLLGTYKSTASDIIELGSYYYKHGIEAKIGDRDFSKTGKELTAGLNEMLDKLDQEHLSVNEVQLHGKCNDASQALKSLTLMYAN